jgi:DNA helicase-2/ATP-dependent DNA helicase PcrA
MIPKITEKPMMLIAGPGAGKTTDMVTRIIQSIPKLRSNRILAAITFTNAASDSIKRRLQEQVKISPNVFIGTNYSFFNQFILMPFASLFGYIGDEKVFLEIDVKIISLTIKRFRPLGREYKAILLISCLGKAKSL